MQRLLADSDMQHLRHGDEPSLAALRQRAIDGIATGEEVGSRSH
ncbi:hypothetical protein ACQP2F_32500 [Actinoplanes sp. CA-030573]